MSQKRILHVNGAMNLGGTDSMIMNIYRNIDRTKFQFDFLYFTKETCHFDEEILSFGGKIFRINSPDKISYFDFIKSTKDILRKNGPFDAIHIHTMLNSGLIAYAAKKENIPIRIIHSHSTKGGKKENIPYKIYELVMKILIKSNGNRFIACGEEASEYLFGKGISNSRTTIIPNAIDIEKYQKRDSDERARLKTSLHIPEKYFVIGQIGTLNDVKNHKFSLEVANQLKQSELDFILLIIGDGFHKNALMSKVLEYNLMENVKFLGIRTDIPSLLSIIDLLIMPSLYEGIPVTLIEAQAAGVPSIISKNISSEVDFQIGLIREVDLNIQMWTEEIKSYKEKKNLVDFQTINRAFNERGYLSYQSVEKLEYIYCDIVK